MFKDAIDTAAESGKADLVEALLRWFCGVSEKECFSATLFTAFDLVSPDVALELGWRFKYTDEVLPYFIQHVKNQAGRIEALEKKLEKSEEKQEEAEAYGQNGLNGNGMLMIGYGQAGAGGFNGVGGQMPQPSPMAGPGMGIGMGMAQY